MSDHDELILCPWCKSDEISSGEVVGERAGEYYTQTCCLNCGACGPEAPGRDSAAANAKWNSFKNNIEQKPLFVPLKTEHYESFEDGSKTDELRQYGPRWNENTCTIGRKVTLSKGYGKKHRMTGTVSRFKKQHGSLFCSTYQAAIMSVYGTLDIDIACIGIKLATASGQV